MSKLLIYLRHLSIAIALLPALAYASSDSTGHSKALSTPDPVEFMAGNKRFGLQYLYDTHFPNSEKFGFFSLTSFASNYHNDLNQLDFRSNAQVDYEIFDGIGSI